MTHVPVWFMRQAGRSLPEYRDLRSRHGILDICRTPELAAEATAQPVRRLGVDAAILFSDIVVPFEALGVEVDIKPGVGPVIDEPIRSRADVDRLQPLDPDVGVAYVNEAVRACVERLEVPLIGFAGAPFTLACYLVEGGPSKDHARTKALMHGEPDLWGALMERLSDAVIIYMRHQVKAGAQALQLFDSWIGQLDEQDFRTHVMPWVVRIFAALADLGVPRIVFGVGTGELLGALGQTGADVVGVDWRVPLDEARTRVGKGVALQGNLDPSVCLAPWEAVHAKATDVLRRGGGHAHVFNLGHGVLPATDPDTLSKLVDLVHEWRPDE